MLDSGTQITKICHVYGGKSFPYRFMCVDQSKCKAPNAFFCQKCQPHHPHHTTQDLQSASQFCKKLRRLIQFQQLLSNYQRTLQQQLSRASKVLQAGTSARRKVFRAMGKLQPNSFLADPNDTIQVFIEKQFENGLSVPVCREFQEFVQSVNYKELSASISTLKKSVERVKSSTYLDEIMMKVFAFQTGSSELLKKMDVMNVADKVVESKLNDIKRKVSCLEQNIKPFDSQITKCSAGNANTFRDSRASSIFSEIVKDLTSLAGASKMQRTCKQTDQFIEQQPGIADKVAPRHITNRNSIGSLTLHSTTLPENKQLQAQRTSSSKFSVSKKTPSNSMISLNSGMSDKGFLRTETKSNGMQQPVQATPEEKSRLLKEFQDLKGNFGEVFATGNVELKWEILKSLEIYATTKIFRLNHNKLSDVTILAQINMKNLKYLHLNNNNISDLSQFSNIDFKSLQVLTLDNNVIKDLSGLCDTNLRLLQVLSINNNLVESLQGLICVNFRTLQGLALSGNLIEDPMPLKSLDYKGMFWVELSKNWPVILENNKFSKEDQEWIRKLVVKNKAGSKICIYI